MVREELVAGLRNALDRGQTLEQAIQSFIVAGYKQEEVDEAVVEFRRQGILPVTEEKVELEKQSIQEKLKNIKKEAKKEGISTGRFIFIILLVLLIISVGTLAVYSYLLKWTFTDMLNNLKEIPSKIIGIFKK